MSSVVGKITTILKELRNTDGGTSVTEIARTLDMPTQTVYRLLKELAEGGLVWQNSETKRWSLGPMLIGLGAMARKQINLTTLARPELESLRNESKETVILTVREGNHGVYVDIVESPQPIRLVEYIGARLPLHVGCSRRAILAFLGAREITEFAQQYCDDEDAREELALECQSIRNRGYAVSLGEVTPDSFGIAAPIWYRDEPVASIMAGGPQHRMQEDEIRSLGELVCRSASTISRALSGSA